MDLAPIQADLSRALFQNALFKDEALVLSRTENSDLLPISKECSRDFFGRVFAPNGPLWGMYSEAKLGYAPYGSTYLNFIAGRMYFCRNVEGRFMRTSGMEKKFGLKDGALTEYAPYDPANLLLLISSPFDMLSQALDISLLPLYVNERISGFLDFKAKALNFYAERKDSPTDPIELALESQSMAAQAMHYSFVSSLAAALGIKLKDSDAWKECEAEELYTLLAGGKKEEALLRFGFHSASPYDISSPRFHEDLKYAKRPLQPFPKDKYARLRENAKFVCSRYLDLARDAYVSIGEESGLGGDIFHLGVPELKDALHDPRNWKMKAQARKVAYEKFSGNDFPGTLVWFSGSWVEPEEKKNSGISGVPAGAAITAEGPSVLVNGAKDYSKDVLGKIIISKTFSPDLAPLLKGAIGLVSESGGALAHSAIIARELGMPCIVQAKGISGLAEGTRIEVNGKTGRIDIK